MADRKESDKANVAAIAQGLVSNLRTIEQDAVPQVVVSTDLTSSMSSSRNAISNRKAGDTIRKQGRASVAYYPQNNVYGYTYPGYDGAYSEWNNNGYFVPRGGLRMPNSTPQLKPPTQPFSAGKMYFPMGRSSSYSQQQRGQFPGSTPTNNRSSGQTWLDNSKVKTNERFNQRRPSEGPTERICGPRAGRKDTLNPPGNKDRLSNLIYQDQYNLPDFQTNYEHAKFYMIKSYNEDDVHKSIKYSVWASTPGGNKKLDDAFRDAENVLKDTATKCPIFLFFSVNTSGKFLGVAEMMGPVDFKKNMDFWQEERWNGFFPLRWHIIKDVPNVNFRTIILQNNDNRAVFFSRDTQEVPFPQGLQMLQIFKNHNAETSILEDLEFYDDREKLLHAKRSCIPSLVRSENDKDYSSSDHLEEAMENLQLSTRASNTA